RDSPGTNSLSSCMLLLPISGPASNDSPVIFPPGRARLEMRPVPMGALAPTMTKSKDNRQDECRHELSRMSCSGGKLVELVERLVHPIRATGAFVECFLRGIEVVHDEQRLSGSFLERDRGDLPVAACFFIGPDEARVRYHLQVPAVESHGLRGRRVA